jgi:hypothetical protein
MFHERDPKQLGYYCQLITELELSGHWASLCTVRGLGGRAELKKQRDQASAYLG